MIPSGDHVTYLQDFDHDDGVMSFHLSVPRLSEQTQGLVPGRRRSVEEFK